MAEFSSRYEIGVVYKVKSRGPRTEPCGTPVSKGEKSEESDPMRTQLLRLERYDVRKSRAGPLIPKFKDSLVRRML